MHRRIWIPAVLAAIALFVVAIFTARSVTPVSAQQILDRAATAQVNAISTQGILYNRLEVIDNVNTFQNGQAGTRTMIESYLDVQTGYVRWVVTDENTGRVLNAFAYEGTYTYSARQPGEGGVLEPLVIDRLRQRPEKLTSQIQNNSMDPTKKARQFFEKFRGDPNVQVEKQTGTDGRSIYILRSQQPAEATFKNNVQMPSGFTTLTFDAQTYRLLESRTTVKQDGKEILVRSDRYLQDEVLPAGTQVAWDLSDLPGVTIVDDPNGER